MSEYLSRGFYDWRESVLSSQLESNTKFVLLVIHTHMNSKNNSAFPSYNLLSKETSLGRATVIRHVQKAVELGWLRKTTRMNDAGEMTSNLYVMTDPNVEEGSITMIPPQSHHETTLVSPRDPNNQLNNQIKSNKGLTKITPLKGLQSTIDEIELSELGVVDEWNEFLQHRKALKSPMTEFAQKRAFQELVRLQQTGEDPKAVLVQSITNGYKGLFPVKSGGHTSEARKGNTKRYASRDAVKQVKESMG